MPCAIGLLAHALIYFQCVMELGQEAVGVYKPTIQKYGYRTAMVRTGEKR